MKTEKEILEAVRVLQEANPHDEGIQNWVRNYFPELKESDDERIRKALINGFNKLDKSAVWYNGITNGQMLTWLEKQGNNNQNWKPSKEQIDAFEHFVRSITESGYASPYDDNTKLLKSLMNDLHKLEKQGEQKAYTLEQAANIFLDALSNSPYNNKPITDAQIITKQLLNFLQNSVSYNPDALISNEQKPAFEMKTPEESLGIDSDTYNKIVDECIYGEQKPADKSEPTDYNSIDPYFGKPIDKVEPKFKVGDWVTIKQ